MNDISIIIFSKDRPMQLNALIESFDRFCLDKEICNIKILYKESLEYDGAYDSLINDYKNIKFIKEKYFYQDFSKLMISCNSKYIMFLVDDIIFKTDLYLNEAINAFESNINLLTFSLRLGKNINYCYPISSFINQPDFKNLNDNIIYWNIDYSMEDWGYPFSMDGNIFEIDFFRKVVFSNHVRPFNSPNELESFLSLVKLFKGEKMASFQSSKLLNVPDNRVQNSFQNKNEGGDFSYMIHKWKEKFKIDISEIHLIDNNSCHYPIKFKLIER